MSCERDTVLHWNGYGGGLHNPQYDDPYVSIGFDAQSLFYPIELSTPSPPFYVINTVNGENSADGLIQYWAVKAKRALEVIDAKTTRLSKDRAFEFLQRMLVVACSLVKTEGWRHEQEYRLLYITEKFGDEDYSLETRPNRRDRYASLKWSTGNMPIRSIMPHPLADINMVRNTLWAIPETKGVSVIASALKPRQR